MGYLFILTPCYACNRPFTCAPDLVPSIRIDGIKHAICKNCMDLANAKRKGMGLAPHPILPGAYEPQDENDSNL